MRQLAAMNTLLKMCKAAQLRKILACSNVYTNAINSLTNCSVSETKGHWRFSNIKCECWCHSNQCLAAYFSLTLKQKEAVHGMILAENKRLLYTFSQSSLKLF